MSYLMKCTVAFRPRAEQLPTSDWFGYTEKDEEQSDKATARFPRVMTHARTREDSLEK